MSSSCNLQESQDNSWKVLVHAIKTASDEGLQLRKHRPALSYEQYLEQCQQRSFSKEIVKNSEDGDAVDANNNLNWEEERLQGITVLGDWESEDYEKDGNNLKSEDGTTVQRHKTTRRRPLYSRKLERIVEREEDWGETACKEPRESEHSDFDDSSWESLSCSSNEDQNFDNFFKASHTDPAAAHLRETENDLQRFKPYTNLTECLLRQYYPAESEPTNLQGGRLRKRKGYDVQKDFQKHGQLTLEERLPLMQVVDVLDEMNKVLKVGKITPRMERILEYNQDHPFTEGYQEETLGWCPWLVYKIEKLCKRISSTQWPYN